MKPRLRRLVNLLLAVIGAGLLALTGTALVPIAQGQAHLAFPVVAAAGVAGIAGWLLHELLGQHFADLRLLQTALELLSRGAVPPEQLQTRWADANPDEVGQLARIINDLASRRAMDQARPDQRLAAVIGALGDAVIVVTETGQISLINSVGKALLGHDRAAVGLSIYGVIDRDSLTAGLAAARGTGGRPSEATLATVAGETLAARITDFGAHAGAVLAIAAKEVEHFAEVEHALDLHDIPPPPCSPRPGTPLESLPGVVLDTETTGLDIERDAICAIGAVRVHGGRVYRGITFDRLVNPGRSIPARSTTVHGITGAMVATAPTAATALPQLRAFAGDSVIIGHNISFDLGILRRAARAAELDWPDPPWLDVLLLAAALDPSETDLNLESMALRLGVNVSGRHTALGDSLVTAEVYARLLPLLAGRGVRTFGEAVQFQRQAKHILAQQNDLGW